MMMGVMKEGMDGHQEIYTLLTSGLTSLEMSLGSLLGAWKVQSQHHGKFESDPSEVKEKS